MKSANSVWEMYVKSDIHNGSVVRLFDKTPTPRRNTDVVCPHFIECAWAYGCVGNCAWCFLKGTFRFVSFKQPDGRVPPHFKDRKIVEREIRRFLKNAKQPYVLDTGELSDSLMGERLKEPFSEFIMDMVAGTQHKVLFLSKLTWVENFLKHEWQKNAILAWSLNAPSVSKRWELDLPTFKQRVVAAKKVADAGYTVRVRFDPMVPVPNWSKKYIEAIDETCKVITPERVTLGTLRGLPSTLGACARAQDPLFFKSWTQYLTESSNWGKKTEFELRFKMLSVAIGALKVNGISKIAVCKDTREMWRCLQSEFGMDYHEMTCNCLP